MNIEYNIILLFISNKFYLNRTNFIIPLKVRQNFYYNIVILYKQL